MFYEPKSGTLAIEGVEVLKFTIEQPRSQVRDVEDYEKISLTDLSRPYGEHAGVQEWEREVGGWANAFAFMERLPQG